MESRRRHLAWGTASSCRAGVRLTRARLSPRSSHHQRLAGLLHTSRRRSGRHVQRWPRRTDRRRPSVLPHEERIRSRQQDPVRPLRPDVHPQVRTPLAWLCLERVLQRDTLRLLDEGRAWQTIPTAGSWALDSDLGPAQSSYRLHVLYYIRRLNAHHRGTFRRTGTGDCAGLRRAMMAPVGKVIIRRAVPGDASGIARVCAEG
jgi:hypothetical protein